VYSTYLGGTNADAGSGIAVDSSFNAHVTGTTSSTDFPTQDALQPTNGGGIQDAFVTKVNPSGSALVYSTYLGGSGDDRGSRIAVDSSSDAYVAGATSSTNFPTTPGTFQASNGGQADGFLSKIRDVGPPATLTLAPAAATNTLGTSHTITATVRDAAGRPVPSIVVRFTVTGAHSVSGSCTTGSNGQCTFAYTGTVAGTDVISAYADSDNDNVRDVGEPIGTAAKVWTAPTPGCPPNGGDDDRDNDGLEDNDEGVFGTQVGLADSDGDGILDGNEDSDHDGVADEDEDDGTDGECPNDSDGDGVDDEDEDDHPVGFAQVLDELGPDIASVESDRTGAA
jgi:hypothetical protein